MPETTFEQSLREIERLQQRAAEAEKKRDGEGAIAALQETLGHTCADHHVLAYEVWDDIHQLHRRAGEFDAAIRAKRTVHCRRLPLETRSGSRHRRVPPLGRGPHCRRRALRHLAGADP